MTNLAASVLRAVQAVVPGVTDILIGSESYRTTWLVSPASLQSAAQPIIDAFDQTATATIDAATAAQADVSARDKDRIASIALIVMRTDTNWGTYTLAQKVSAVQAAITTWKTLRAFVEKNL